MIVDPENLTLEEAKQTINLAIDRYNSNECVVDSKLLPFLKQISGAEWESIFKAGSKAIFMNPEKRSCTIGNLVFISPEHKHHLGAFSHEVGHQKYEALKLEKDTELIKIYDEEKNAYLSTFPEAAHKEINYFIKMVH